MITEIQCRGAQGMLIWTRDDLAHLARVGLRTIADLENCRRKRVEASLAAIRCALDSAGIAFIPEKWRQLLREIEVSAI